MRTDDPKWLWKPESEGQTGKPSLLAPLTPAEQKAWDARHEPTLPGVVRHQPEPVQQPIPGFSTAQEIAAREARYRTTQDAERHEWGPLADPAFRLSDRLDYVMASTDATMTTTNGAEYERAGLKPGQTHQTARGFNDPSQRADVIHTEIGPVEPQPGFIRRTAADLLAAGERLIGRLPAHDKDLILPDQLLDRASRGDRW